MTAPSGGKREACPTAKSMQPIIRYQESPLDEIAKRRKRDLAEFRAQFDV